MSSPERGLSEAEQQALLGLARESIAHGLRYGEPLRVDARELSDRLLEPGAAFVTLHLDGQLRGCVGNLHARGRLVDELARAAFSAAFRDPRFPPLRAEELARLDIHVSVLSPPVPLEFHSEEELLAQLRPGVDGLILSDQGRMGTFLPQVWDKIDEPREFLAQLRLKAGLPRNHWSDSLKVERYTTQSFP